MVICESIYTAATIGGIFVIIGTLIGCVVSYFFSYGLIKKSEYAKACAEFQISFSEFIYWVEYDATLDSIRTAGKLKDFHQKHYTAINRFRTYLSPIKRLSFDTACEKFYNKDGNKYYFKYGGIDSSPDRNESRNLVLKHIKALLEFAKY